MIDTAVALPIHERTPPWLIRERHEDVSRGSGGADGVLCRAQSVQQFGFSKKQVQVNCAAKYNKLLLVGALPQHILLIVVIHTHAHPRNSQKCVRPPYKIIPQYIEEARR